MPGLRRTAPSRPDAGGLVADLYEAALGQMPWEEAGERLKRLAGARSSSLWLLDRRGRFLEGLGATGLDPAAVDGYVAHYHRLDPWAPRCAAEPGPRARRGAEFAAEAEVVRSEWYADYAGRFGIHHALGAVMPVDAEGGHAAVVLHRPRDATDFAQVDVRRLDALLPHLQRALQLRRRLGAAPAADGVRPGGHDALDALATAALVADAAGRVLFANRTAEALAAAGDGLLLARSTPWSAKGLEISAAHPTDAAALRALVSAAARGGAGGAAGLRRPSGRPPLAALVSPLPRRLGANGTSASALVLVSEPDDRAGVGAGALGRIFHLTAAEAEVAAALARGMTAEQVAAGRGSAQATVRAQVRAVLAKTGAEDLRDLARLVGALASLRRG